MRERSPSVTFRSVTPNGAPALILAALVALAAAGCPGGRAEAERAAATAPAVVGSVHRFRLAAGAEQTLTVLGLEPAGVRYEVRTTVAGAPVGEPLVLRFASRPAPALPEGEDVTLDVGERALPCRVEARAGRRVFWARGPEGVAFPGVIRVEEPGGEPSFELIAIESPATAPPAR